MVDLVLIKRGKNAKLQLHQSLGHFGYIWYVFIILAPYCSSLPNFRKGRRAGKTFYALNLYTRSLPCFTLLKNMFYPHNKKIIPLDIFHYLTPVALAHWIMGDGTRYSKNSLFLCTDSYSLSEVTLLTNVLIIKYGFSCSIREVRFSKITKSKQWRILIDSSSMPTLRALVEPYMAPTMLYKIQRK
jgi:hypothetical protein